MKRTMTRVILVLLVAAMALGMVACGETTNNKTTGVDFSQYPAKFEDWTMGNLKAYLRETGIITNDSWVIDVSENEIVAMGVTAGTMYVDMTAGTISDMFFYCDSTAEGMADVLQGIRDSKTILGALPMDAMLGEFVISYGNTVDEAHRTALVKALKDLAEQYKLTFDFITE